jgi:hypothetical protein
MYSNALNSIRFYNFSRFETIYSGTFKGYNLVCQFFAYLISLLIHRKTVVVGISALGIIFSLMQTIVPGKLFLYD